LIFFINIFTFVNTSPN